MRAWPLHVVFATILAGSLAAKERAADMLVWNHDLRPAAIRVAQAQGLAFRDYATFPGTDVRAMAFEAPGCSRPVLVVPMFTIFDYEPLVRSAGEQGDVVRYVYIDGAWEKPDPRAVFLARAKYVALAGFSLTRYVPSPQLLLVQSPSQCQAAAAVDWRDVWSRDYVGLTAPVTEASIR
jgi:hypothetical protein